ncbi:MAG: 16S rRNA (guanine(527)-N(7))-methyltransferase RsmG [Pseudomonadota bacterium]
MILDLDVSRETTDRLRAFLDALLHWNKRINLISKASEAVAWERHVADSAQIYRLAEDNWKSWVDLGSGGGLPGMVIAILAAELRPEGRITLVEADRRKAAFLREASRLVGVSVEILPKRSEDLSALGADVVSARAVAPLSELAAHAQRHMAPGGTGLFLKGRRADTEVAEALERWHFTCEKIPSQTDPEAAVLKIGDLRRV